MYENDIVSEGWRFYKHNLQQPENLSSYVAHTLDDVTIYRICHTTCHHHYAMQHIHRVIDTKIGIIMVFGMITFKHDVVYMC